MIDVIVRDCTNGSNRLDQEEAVSFVTQKVHDPQSHKKALSTEPNLVKSKTK